MIKAFLKRRFRARRGAIPLRAVRRVHRAPRGHKYLTLVYQIDADCRRLLYVARDRTEESLRGFFKTVPEDSIKSLKFICTDMWRQYMNVIAEKAADAVHILDRYHVMKKFGDALNKVRVEEARQLKADGYEEVLKGSRWCLLKRPENLTQKRSMISCNTT